MPDAALLPALKEAIRQNEIGPASPYILSYARKGKSGASFGAMQGDTNVSPRARSTLRDVLAAAGCDQPTVDRILHALSAALPNGSPLNSADAHTANAALDSAAGRALVDAMDEALLEVVLDGLDSCLAASATRGLGIEPLACLYIAPWINMSGAPTLLNAWLKGAAIHGVPPPAGPQVLAADVAAYLQSCAYFQTHPKNFIHYQQCVELGAQKL